MTTGRSTARIARFAVIILFVFGCFYILSRGSTYSVQSEIGNQNSGVAQKAPEKPTGESIKVESPQGAQQHEVPDNKVVDRPEDEESGKAAADDGDRVKATFVTLARNSDLLSLLESIRSVQDRFNHKYNYDWVFLNDEEFSEEFKAFTSSIVTGKTKYGLIPKDEWGFPPWIDQEKAAHVREKMREDRIIYGDSKPYRFMCRYESGFFWRHELLMEYDYYWRVEPSIKIYCDVDYDIFKFMRDNNKDYGFTITLPEYKETIPTLWETTKEFIDKNPQYLAQNNLMNWISSDKGKTYNGCHFWSNFEVGNLNFWRSEAYTKYFEYLDQAGGFFYERWGDAPVHSIAVALFLPMDRVHFFNDVGYYHVPFHNCPVDQEVRIKKNCVCDPKQDFTWKGYSCTSKFHTLTKYPRLKGWEQFAD